ncbi:MAG: aldose epimerase family protein [Bacteroidales bacterium]
MIIDKKSFGHLADGKEVFEFTLSNKSGMRVKVINFGGIITSVLVPDRDGIFEDVVPGHDTLEDYLADPYYFGAIVGRHANRIAEAKFILDGQQIRLNANNGNCHLHGGIVGFNKVFWDIEPIQNNDNQSLKLYYLSPDGEEGFPGNLSITVIYTLTSQNEIVVDYSATTDKTTVLNLTQHSYFNLSAGKQKDILSHELQLFASHFLPTNTDQIPTGERRSVEGSVFDFRSPKLIGRDIQLPDEQLILAIGYDHTWIIDHETNLAKACCLTEPESGRRLEIFTTEPGVHFYSGNYLNCIGKGKNGQSYPFRYAMGLETQHFPNSVNEPSFPSVYLHPGEKFSSQTVYKFSVKSHNN